MGKKRRLLNSAKFKAKHAAHPRMAIVNSLAEEAVTTTEATAPTVTEESPLEVSTPPVTAQKTETIPIVEEEKPKPKKTRKRTTTTAKKKTTTTAKKRTTTTRTRSRKKTTTENKE